MIERFPNSFLWLVLSRKMAHFGINCNHLVRLLFKRVQKVVNDTYDKGNDNFYQVNWAIKIVWYPTEENTCDSFHAPIDKTKCRGMNSDRI